MVKAKIIDYPTTHEDIDRFEIDNQVSVFIYYISDDDAIRTEKKGIMSNRIRILLKI